MEETKEKLFKMSYSIQFLVVCALAVLGCGKVTLQGRASRKYIVNTADSVLFNAQVFAAITVVLLAVFPWGRLNKKALILGVVFGVFTVAFQIVYSLALKAGPVSLTVLIVNFSAFFIALYSVIVFGETVYLTYLIGAVLLVISMVLNVNREKDGKTGGWKWFLMSVTAMLATSGGSIVVKIFGKTLAAELENSDMTFMAMAYAISAVLAFAVYLIRAYAVGRERSTYGFHWGVLGYAAAVGVVLGIYQKFYAMGMEKMDASFMMPTYAGMQSLGMTVIGVLLFRDRLSPRQIVGIVCGILCVVVMNLRILPLF